MWFYLAISLDINILKLRVFFTGPIKKKIPADDDLTEKTEDVEPDAHLTSYERA